MAALTRWSRGDKVTRRVPPLRDCSRAARARGCWHVVRAESTAAARLARARQQQQQQQQQQAQEQAGEARAAASARARSRAALWSYVSGATLGRLVGWWGAKICLKSSVWAQNFSSPAARCKGGRCARGRFGYPPPIEHPRHRATSGRLPGELRVVPLASLTKRTPFQEQTT